MVYKPSALLNLDRQIEKMGDIGVKSSLNVVVTFWYLCCVSICTVAGNSGMKVYTERWSYPQGWKLKTWQQDNNKKI